MRAAVALAALSVGCLDYAHTSMHNAPGLTDLATPMAFENGNPARYEPPTAPDNDVLTIYAEPYLIGGRGRIGSVGETGLEMRFEHSHHMFPVEQTLAVTAGVGLVQWHEDRGIPGAFYAELNYRFVAGGSIPIDVGAGPAAYTGSFEVGGQISLRLPLFLMRVRYLPDSHTEIMAGLEVPIPFVFGRSQ